MSKHYILFAFLVFQITVAQAQEKFEKEARIKSKEVPQKALEFVDQLGLTKKIKWYREEGINKMSFEAKSKKNGAKYSVEFDDTGTIEDIEKKIKWNAIPSATQKNIRSYLDMAHQKTRIRKIQVQYTGEAAQLIEVVNVPKNTNEVTIHYEIVVKAKTGKKYELLEYLFTNSGEMRTKSIIINRNTDNLEY